MTRKDKIRQDKTRPGNATQRKATQDNTRQHKATQDNTAQTQHKDLVENPQINRASYKI